MSHSEREKAQQEREANQMKKAHMTRQVRGGRERESVKWALVMESVFPTKVSF